MKGAQTGGSEAGLNWLGYIIQNAPGIAMLVMPSLDMVRRNTTVRIDPLIEATPALRGLVAAPRSRDAGNSLFRKSFPGGQLVMTGANSAVGLRSTPVRYLFLDEVDGYPGDADGEIALPAAVIAAARDTFIATPKLKLLLDAEGVARVAEAIRAAFPDAPPDILVIDPIRNLFDGGPEGGGENDNTAMMFFLKDRVELLREAVNPDAGVILAHHTRKASKHQVKDDPFLALSGASALRGFYTSGLLMHRPDEDSTVRRLEIELRNGPALPGKLIDKVKGEWVELNPLNERLVRKEVGAKLDAERLRKHDVILGMLLDEAAGERLYTAMQFAETFENRGGLGSKHSREIAAMEPQPMRVWPSAAAITRLEQTFDWVLWIEEAERKLVWSRAARVPWKQISGELGCDRTTAWRRWQLALTKIAARLNAQ